MKKLKLFINNFLVYGVGGVISKLVPLVMIPIITRLMPSTDYLGISDLSNTIVQFASAIAIMGIYDAVFRMFFEKDDDNFKKNICSTALLFTTFSSTVVFFLLLLFKEQIAYFFFNDKKYAYLVYISAMAALVSSTNSIVSAPTRMQNKKKVFLLTNTLSPLISYGVSIPMLMAGHYTIALPLAAVVSGITMEIAFGVMNREWFNLKRYDAKLLRLMLKIAIPLVPNFLIYWVFNSCDKLMISNMIGIGAAGIYSVGSKLGNVSQLIYVAFAGGWQFFAFSTMKDENQVESNSKIFEYLGIISFVATTFVCVYSYQIFKLLFTEQYLSGYIVSPYLFMAPLLQMLYQVAANQFLVVKKTWPTMLILSTGAIVNVIINFAFIPVFGIEGAAIATLIGYAVSDVICVFVLCRMHLMVISFRFIVATISMLGFLIVWRVYFISNCCLSTIMAICFSMFICALYKSDISNLIAFLKGV